MEGGVRFTQGQSKSRKKEGIERGGGAQHLLARVENQPLPGKQVLRIAEGDERVVDRPSAGEKPSHKRQTAKQKGNEQIAFFCGTHSMIIAGGWVVRGAPTNSP